MNLICVASPKGGVGKTTITANLAHALQRLGQQVVVIDFDPQNALRLHFGMPLDTLAGHVRDFSLVKDCSHHLRDSDCGVRYLPYGRVSTQEELKFDALLAEQPHFLAHFFQPLLNRQNLIVIADLPPGHSAALSALGQFNPLILTVLLADSASLSVVPEVESGRFYELALLGRCYYVLNQLDRRSQLSADIAAFLTQRLGSALLGIVHRDEAVAEANANQMLIFKYTNTSVVVSELDGVAKKIHRLFNKN